ncbi:MAG: ABC transporter permease [Oscillospiraceae bacterium]|nr:ABC transporter permease [Oscillospiraceae bacterium]
MKNIFLLIGNSIQRNKVAVFSACICAVSLSLIMALFGNIQGEETISRIKIGLIDHDGSALSAAFRHYLTDTLNMELIEDQTYDELSTTLINRRISVIVEIPENFENAAVRGQPEDLITTSLSDFENAAFVDAYLNSYMNSISVLGLGAAGDSDVFHELLLKSETRQISVASTAVPKLEGALEDDEIIFINDSVYEDDFVPAMGFYVMFGFFFTISIAFMVFDDRSSGIYKRIQSTPVTSVQYIVGSTLFGVINGLLIIGLFFAYLLLSRTKIVVPYWSAILLMALMMLFMVGFALMLALLLKSKSAVLTVIFAYSSIASMIGGAWFPIDFGPDSLQKLAKITPNYWFMDAFNKMQENTDANIVSNIIVLVLFIILVYLVSAIRFSQNKNA